MWSKTPVYLPKPLSSSLVPSMVPSAWSCKWKPCRLYSFVTIPFSCGSAEGETEGEERDRLKRHCHSDSVRGFKASGLAKLSTVYRFESTLQNKRSDYNGQKWKKHVRTGENMWQLQVYAKYVHRATFLYFGLSCITVTKTCIYVMEHSIKNSSPLQICG